ncbi:MAG: LON peptidase substrate-binding domain-containing protein [Polaromonas sp.]|nr:LON peptidase substrate-binding domain-containing protein [Polaromonas sp.]
MPLTDALPLRPLTALPLFPLGTVLYPGGFLPLQIFEVRYLDMIGKCHKNGTAFGVVSLTAGTEVRRLNAEPSGEAFANEAFQSMGTLATITDFATPQPGLMVVRCTGTQRFKISRSEKLKHGLWVADVTLLPDDLFVAIPEDLQPAADALKKLILTLQEREVPADQMPIFTPYKFDDCGWVANRWCELLPIPVAMKQQFMELDNPLLRLELVNDILDRSDISF